jgi:hypothetical protein
MESPFRCLIGWLSWAKVSGYLLLWYHSRCPRPVRDANSNAGLRCVTTVQDFFLIFTLSQNMISVRLQRDRESHYKLILVIVADVICIPFAQRMASRWLNEITDTFWRPNGPPAIPVQTNALIRIGNNRSFWLAILKGGLHRRHPDEQFATDGPLFHITLLANPIYEISVSVKISLSPEFAIPISSNWVFDSLWFGVIVMFLLVTGMSV